MAFKWTMRLAPAGTLLGAGYLAVGYSDSAHGTIGENERPETIVEAAAARQHERPLELMPSEIATTQPSSMVERLRVSGELEPINRAILRAKDGGRILEIRAREGEAIEAGNALRYRRSPIDPQAAGGALRYCKGGAAPCQAIPPQDRTA